MSFLFSVQNPNPYPILLEGIQFTVNFDNDFDVVTVNNQDSYWIPAGKTTNVRTTTMITVRSALLSLLVTGGFKLKEKGWDCLGYPGKMVEGGSGYDGPRSRKGRGV